MEKLTERFMNYARINTESNEKSLKCPSSPAQMELLRLLKKELIEIGMKEVILDKNGYLMATLSSNIKKKVPTIGFISHVDTSSDVSGKDIQPQIISNYYGKNIILNKKKKITLSPRDFPALNNYMGQSIITSDGTTLIGADDKAGIAEIVTAMELLINKPEIEHGKIRIAFTPDEEIGRGADKFDIKKFGAEFAFTVDGGPIGELEYENFNAARARISIQGMNVHPGTAKNRMKNSMHIAFELESMLPQNAKPEYTDGYEGFYHLTEFTGTVDHTRVSYIIRDHEKPEFMRKKDLLIKIVDHLNLKYGSGTVKIIMVDQYYNMREKLEDSMHIVQLAQQAMIKAGLTPKIKPIRGGTDGSKLTFKGLPCPNIFTGGHNFHSRFEFIPISSMKKAVEVIINIAELHAKGVK